MELCKLTRRVAYMYSKTTRLNSTEISMIVLSENYV